MKNVNLPMDKMYEQMGADAFAAGIRCAPCSDPEIMKEVAESKGNGAAIMKLWIKGWTRANLRAEVKMPMDRSDFER